MTKITAAVVPEKGDKFEIRHDINLCKMGNDDLLVHMVASGICHSDEAIRAGVASLGYPVILGHEGSGIVEKVGPEVKNFKPGDHVVLSFYSEDGCINCDKGMPTKCLNYAANNLSGVRPDGTPHFTDKNGKRISDMFDQSSFTTETVVRENNAVKVSKDLDLRKVGPLGCGYMTGSGAVFNTINSYKEVRPGTIGMVAGTGAVGLAAMMAFKISGCTTIIAVDQNEDRLKLAEKLGATDTINTKNVNSVPEAVKQITNGAMADYAVDTTGYAPLVQQEIPSMAQGGVLAAIAVTDQKVTVDTWNNLSVSDQAVVGSNMGDGIPQVDIPRLIKFYKAGMFPFDKTEKFFDFKDINKANHASVDGSVIKPVLIIDKNYKPGK